MNNITVGCAVSASTVATGSACSGVSGSVPGLGYPGMYFQDAGNGVCGQDGVSAFASGVPVGASWVMDLAYERGLYMGAEFERKSGNVALGPVFFWDPASLDHLVEPASDACLIFLNEYSSEWWERAGLTDKASDELVLYVANQCANTMVFIHDAGIRRLDASVEHPTVTAVMYAHLPGQDARRALVSLMYGHASPSGRLPYTVGKTESDHGSLLGPCPSSIYDTNPQYFTEGVNIDYRSFLARNVTPRYDSGYRLTYSEFGKPVTFSLRKKDISQWDVVSPQWVQPKGTYQRMVGATNGKLLQ
ncbi:hypothetical protein LTR65_003370 [Meristemomyces frigidus]